MEDQDKTKEQLMNELAELRQQVAELEAGDTECKRAEDEVRRHLERAEALREIDRTIASTLDLTEVLNVVLDELERVIPYHSAGIFLLSNGTAKLTTGRGFPDLERALQVSFPVQEDALTREVLQQKRPLVLADAQADERFLARGGTEYVRSWIGVPLIAKGEATGFLTIDHREPGVYDEQSAEIAQGFASQAAIAIENARLFQESQRRAEEMAALREVSLATLSTLERDQVFEIMLDQLGAVIDYDTAAIKIITPDGRDKMIVGRGPIIYDQAMWNGFDVKDNKLLQEMEETKQAVVVHDTQTDERYERVGDWEVFRSWVGAPLFVKNDLIGYLAVEKTSPGFYDESAVQLLGDFAHAAAIALENARLYEGIRQELAERKRAEEEIKERNRELAALNAIATTMMQSALDLDEVLQRTAEGVVEGLGCNTAFMFLLDEEEGVFKGSAVSTKDKMLERMNAIIGFPLLQIKIPARRDFNEAMSNLLDGRPTIKHDFYELVRPLWSKPVCYAMQRLLDSRTFFTAPLMAKGKTVGGIVASTREELSEGETEKLMTFANQAAIAIENARLYEEAQKELGERKRAEEALRDAKEFSDGLIASMLDGVSILDSRGVHVDANAAFCQMTGFSREELIGVGLPHPYWPPEAYEEIEKAFQKTLRGEFGDCELTFMRKNGERFPVSVSPSWVNDKRGNVISYFATVKDITERKRAEEELRQSYVNLQRALEGTVHVLVSAIEMRDPYTAGHQRRVTQLVCAIAKEMGLLEKQIEGIRMAGLIHDLGKINVPAEILSKPGPLTEIEFGLIKMHPQVGHDILSGAIDFPWPVAQIVLQHHERTDGSGYPQGLSGEEIILEARVLGVADVVEAMASYRPYRSALGINKALEEISGNRGVLYDPEVVDACLKLFTEKGFEFE